MFGINSKSKEYQGVRSPKVSTRLKIDLQLIPNQYLTEIDTNTKPKRMRTLKFFLVTLQLVTKLARICK